MKILKDLSIGETDMSKLGDLTAKHTELLKHALKCRFIVFDMCICISFMSVCIHICSLHPTLNVFLNCHVNIILELHVVLTRINSCSYQGAGGCVHHTVNP